MKKKYTIAAVCLVIVIGILGFVVEMKGESTTKPETRINTNVANNKPSPSSKPVDLNKYASYENTNGDILYYPKSWTENKSEMSNHKGTIFLLQPENPSSQTNPHITVEVVDANLSSIGDLTSEFGIFGYKKTKEIIGGNTATKYQRPIPTPQGTLHSTAYIYEKSGTIYLFKLGYKQDIVDQQLEDEFTQIATNFSAH
ncbi:MAG: hypothetical protein ACR2LN_00870 [Candidatus Levyibacteriota bacterium]